MSAMRYFIRWTAALTALIWLPIASYASETVLADADTISLAKDQLKAEMQRLHPDVTEWRIAPIVQSTHRDPPSADSSATVEVLKTGSRSAVRISWREKDHSLRSQTIWFDVSGNRSVFVVSRDFNVREELSMAEVTSSERDILGIRCTPIQSEAEVAGMRTTRALRSGAALCKEAIEPEPAVARGDKVIVRYESERVSLTSKGVAQQDARVGEALRVVNPATKDSFVAVVSGVREVVVHE